jgi:hypothetical protein
MYRSRTYCHRLLLPPSSVSPPSLMKQLTRFINPCVHHAKKEEKQKKKKKVRAPGGTMWHDHELRLVVGFLSSAATGIKNKGYSWKKGRHDPLTKSPRLARRDNGPRLKNQGAWRRRKITSVEEPKGKKTTRRNHDPNPALVQLMPKNLHSLKERGSRAEQQRQQRRSWHPSEGQRQ